MIEPSGGRENESESNERLFLQSSRFPRVYRVGCNAYEDCQGERKEMKSKKGGEMEPALRLESTTLNDSGDS